MLFFFIVCFKFRVAKLSSLSFLILEKGLQRWLWKNGKLSFLIYKKYTKKSASSLSIIDNCQ